MNKMTRIKNVFLIGLVIFGFELNAKEYHVSIKGNDGNPGRIQQPLHTISYAAKLAQPGDTITVHEGIYREEVKPPRGGKSNLSRIVYRAAPGEKVVIKGSEVIKDWKKVGNGVWKATIENSIFKDYNPYKDTIWGDWFNPKGQIHHTGEVYLNEKSLYEVPTLDMVKNPVPYEDSRDKENSVYKWYVENNKETTVIWANFHQYNPNKELVEINVRRTCFYPERPGIDYITVSGFHMGQAATQWAPPTSEQVALLGTHYSKGWIIENNTISNSKCVGISLGKDRQSGHNVWTKNPKKPGVTHQTEVIFRALNDGWSKEKVGSHVVRDNVIYDCGQAGIVGHLGAIFSEIYNNHIYDIWVKRMFTGAEMAGIKLHAAIDVTIRNNRIHNVGRGLWLDWEAQGTRVTKNLFYDNTTDDVYCEVNHGPYLIDNNIMLSVVPFRDASQGGAIVHNLMNGYVMQLPIYGRFTPYHYPHSTKIAGVKNIPGGDNRFINNIFILDLDQMPDTLMHPINKRSTKYHGLENLAENVKYPMYVDGNVYYLDAKPGKTDNNYVENAKFDPEIKIKEENNKVYVTIQFDKEARAMQNKLVTTGLLGTTIISEAIFENPDGAPYRINEDYFGNSRNERNPSPGPFENLEKRTYKVW